MLTSIRHENRELIVVGDRILVAPESGSDRTDVGLYLPQTVTEKEKVQSGRIVAVGPGLPLPDMSGDDDEPWKRTEARPRHVPMQAQEGDLAIFLRKAAVEIRFDGDTYLVVPQGAVLLLLRDKFADV